MTVGTSTFMGLGMPVYGEAELTQQTAATDILTITGASAQTGDFIVCRNSTGAELFVVSSSGAVTSNVGMSFTSATLTGALATTSNINFTISSTTATNYGIKFTLGASAVAAALIEYDSGITGVCNSFFQVNGSLAPTYLFSVGASAAGVGAAADNGFFNASMTWTVFPTSAVACAGVKFLAGSKVYYIPAWPDTTFNA